MENLVSTLFIFGGGAFLLCALVAFCLEAVNTGRRTLVKLKVVDMRPETGHQGATYLHPEYVVVSGPQAGLRKVSTAGTFPALHRKNEIVEGYLDPITNEVRSLKESKIAGWCIAGLVGLGAAMILVGLNVDNSQILAWIF